MLSSNARLLSRQGQDGTPRLAYFQALLAELQGYMSASIKTLHSYTHMHQILAHFGNFAYDPLNYKSLLALNVIECFLDGSDFLNTMDAKSRRSPDVVAMVLQCVEASLHGLCNCIVDERVQKVVLEKVPDGLDLVVSWIIDTKYDAPSFSKHAADLRHLSALTILYFILKDSSKKTPPICYSEQVVKRVQEWSAYQTSFSSSTSTSEIPLKNLAILYQELLEAKGHVQPSS